MKSPNIVFVFADQWRAQATGYNGNPVVKTPYLDALTEESINFTHAVSGCPVCSPYRASLLTGQYPLTHGVFVNDVCLSHNAVSLADAYNNAGYDTAYIGKWHLDGHGRSNYIPTERRQGFDYWKVVECTHDYNHSPYYADDSEEKLHWEGYDAFAQTCDARQYIRNHDGESPFLLVLSLGPPHYPYETAPDKYKELYDPEGISLRPNVPAENTDAARKDIAGYYAHCSALDACLGELLQTLKEKGIADNTIFVFTSDHGDMLYSQGEKCKQRPWDESIRVPFLLRYPAMFGYGKSEVNAQINAPDIMPTLMGLSGIPIPESVEGIDFFNYLNGGDDPSNGETLIMCPHPFAEYHPVLGGREYRGLRTHQYTYVRDLNGPWLLYDNELDPYQQQNLINSETDADACSDLDRRLQVRLDSMGDEFLPGTEYLKQWGYTVDDTGAVPFSD